MIFLTFILAIFDEIQTRGEIKLNTYITDRLIPKMTIFLKKG